MNLMYHSSDHLHKKKYLAISKAMRNADRSLIFFVWFVYKSKILNYLFYNHIFFLKDIPFEEMMSVYFYVIKVDAK
jgi:hypothetical protein